MGPEFDVIVVGAGPAGSAAALTLARKGARVLLLEKAKVPGEKNLSGGVIYGDFPGRWGLASLLPDFESTAPLERKVISHEVVVLGAPDFAKGKCRYYRLSKTSLPARSGIFQMSFETGHDYTVLRVPFDRWFAGEAVKAGAVLEVGTTVDGLLSEEGAIVGVRTIGQDIRAKLVIDASGVSSNLVSEAGLRGPLTPRQLYHAVKHVYALEPGLVEKRFRIRPGDGRAVFFLGDFMDGISGGGFIFTNRDTLSVGLAVSLDSYIRTATERFDIAGKMVDVLQGFESHPFVADLLDGGKILEYSSHNVPKGYRAILKRPYADGFLVAGDALGSFVKIGPMLDGMRRAITSGMMAATTYLEASSSGSYRSRNLSRYRELLAPIYEDVNRSGRDGFISESSLAYRTLPRLVLATRLLSSVQVFASPGLKGEGAPLSRAELTGFPAVEKDESSSHIKADLGAASSSISKPWVPACPADCFTVSTPAGEFASIHGLYLRNLGPFPGSSKTVSRSKAVSQTSDDLASATLKFDYSACISCGTCGAIGPKEMIAFGHERGGYGVSYKFG